jgi:hypothetical protein
MIRIVLHTAHGSLHGQLDRPDNPRGLILVARAHRLPKTPRWRVRWKP